MKAVNLLLARFSQLQPPDAEIKKMVSATVNNLLSLEIKPEQVEIKRNNVYLNISAVQKNIVFINREQIVSKLGQRFKLF